MLNASSKQYVREMEMGAVHLLSVLFGEKTNGK
jgi:hypothetical protein